MTRLQSKDLTKASGTIHCLVMVVPRYLQPLLESIMMGFVDNLRRTLSSLASALSVVFNTHPASRPTRSNTTLRSSELLTILAPATDQVQDSVLRVSDKEVVVSTFSKSLKRRLGSCVGLYLIHSTVEVTTSRSPRTHSTAGLR